MVLQRLSENLHFVLTLSIHFLSDHRDYGLVNAEEYFESLARDYGLGYKPLPSWGFMVNSPQPKMCQRLFNA